MDEIVVESGRASSRTSSRPGSYAYRGLVGVSSEEPGTGVSNPALAEGGVIHHHEGILGIADLVPAIHGWTDPVAEVVIERVS